MMMPIENDVETFILHTEACKLRDKEDKPLGTKNTVSDVFSATVKATER